MEVKWSDFAMKQLDDLLYTSSYYNKKTEKVKDCA